MLDLNQKSENIDISLVCLEGLPIDQYTKHSLDLFSELYLF